MAAKDWKVGDVVICETDRFGRICPRGFESTITAPRLGVGKVHDGWFSTDAVGEPSAMEFEKFDEWFSLKSDAPTNSEVAQLQARVAELEGALAAEREVHVSVSSASDDELTKTRDALRRLEVSANSVAYCYSKRPENFAGALQSLRDDAAAAREVLGE